MPTASIFLSLDEGDFLIAVDYASFRNGLDEETEIDLYGFTVSKLDGRWLDAEDREWITSELEAIYERDEALRDRIKAKCLKDAATLEPRDLGLDDVPDNYFSRMNRTQSWGNQ